MYRFCPLFFSLIYVVVGSAQTPDIGVSAILSPTNSCGFSSLEPVKVSITNFGTDPATAFPVRFLVDGMPGAPEVFPGTLAAGATVDYTFLATADLSSSTSWTFSARTELATDPVPGNDALSVNLLSLSGAGLPLSDAFESYTPPSTIFSSGLINLSGDDLDFQVHNGPTTSASTGPSTGAGGSGNYIYMEASPAAAGDRTILSSGCLDLGGGLSPRLVYGYHMYGNGIGYLLVTAWQGGHGDTLRLWVGQQHTSSADPWKYDTLSLAAYSGLIELRFEAAIGFTGSSFNADIALDDILVENPVPADVRVSSLIDPVPTCGLTAMETITLGLGNLGLVDQSGFDVGFLINGPTGTFSGSENIGALVVPAGSTIPFALSTAVDLSLTGSYSMQFWTALSGDAVPANDTLTLLFDLPGLTLPALEDFNSYPDGTTAFLQWENDPFADEPFQVNFGGTSSTATGPSGDVNGSGGYIYMEASNMAFLEEATIRSQCISLSSGTAPKFQYAYHMFGASIGSLTVSIESGGVLTPLSSLIGQQQTTSSAPWRFDTLDLAPYLGTSFQLVLTGKVGSTGSAFNSDISLDELSLYNPLDNDLGISAILAPQSSCGDESAAAIQVQISNFGTNPQSGFLVGYQIEGPLGTSTVLESTGTLSLAAGASANYMFSTPADLSADGVYDIRVWTALPTDALHLNDTLETTVINEMAAADLATAAFSDNFNSYPDGTVFFPTFLQDVLAPLEFEVNYGTTSSTATGPSGDVEGPGGYVYIESSGSVAGDYGRICSGCMDLSGTVSPVVEFAYHLYGASIGSLEVTVLDSDGLSTPFSLFGPQMTATTDPWGLASVDLSPWIGEVVNVCFIGTVGSTGSSFNSDIALDNIVLRDVPPADLGVVQLLHPAEASCDFSTTESVAILLHNFGTVAQSGFDVGYRLEGPGGTVTVSENVGSLLVEPDSSRLYTFGTPVDLSTDGLYELKTYTDVAADGIVSNDTLTSVLENISAVTSFPFVEDFESFLLCGSTCTVDCSGSVANGWIQDPNDDADWMHDANGTPTSGTGPAIDRIPGTTTGQYLYTESSGVCTLITANLISPCLDLSALTIPAVRFYYHMFGLNTGSLALDVSSDDGTSWSEVWSRSGEDQTSSLDAWKLVVQPLYGITGSVRLRFRGTTGNGTLSDIAIDGIEVLDVPPFDDLSVVQLLQPVSSCAFDGPVTVGVLVSNLGTGILSGFDLGYSISGPIASSASESTGSFTLAPGETDTFFFSTPVNLSADGDYTLHVFPLLVGDANPLNDTLTAFVTNIPTLGLPLADDFNSYPDGGTSFDFLENDLSAVLLFEANYGPTSSTGTGPSDDVTVGGGYIYMEASFGTFLDEARLCTPCLDLSEGSTAPELEYAYHMAGTAVGGLRVDVIEEGVTTTVDLLTGPQQISETAPWKTSLVDLSAFDGNSVQVCFTGRIAPSGSGSAFLSDIALDEIRFRDPAADDLGVTEVFSPETACGLTDAEIVQVEVTNFGVAGQIGFNVHYQSGMGPVVTEVFPDSLRSGESALFTFATPADLSTEGTYTLKAWTGLPTDASTSNDSSTASVTHVLTIDEFPYVEGFESGAPGWTTSGTNNSWEIGVPGGTVITSAPEGSRVLATNLDGFYNNSERSYVLSPCMDLSGLDNPGLRFNLIYQAQATITTGQDGAVLQSSVDQGVTWRKVGDFGDPDGWFNYNNISSNPGEQLPGFPVANGWSGSSGGWITARHALDGLAGESSVLLRLAFATDPTIATLEGIGVDAFVVADMPSVSFGPDISVCAGYELDAGNPGSSYLWSTGATTQRITVSSTGFYTVTVTDTLGFTATDGINITVLPSPALELGPDQTACGSLILDAGNPGADHFWNTGEVTQMITVTESGTYAVLVENSTGCQARDTIQVTIQQNPEAGFAFVQSGAYVEFSDASSAADNWSWDFGDGSSSTDSDPNHIYGASGNYLVTLVVTNPCGSDTLSQTLAIFANGLEDQEIAGWWSIYPVPAEDILYIRLNSPAGVQNAVAGLFDVNGKLLQVERLQNPAQLDLSHLASGTYILRLDFDGRQSARTFLRQ